MTEPATSRKTLRFANAPIAIPAVLLAAGAWSHRWVSDDAFITFRSAVNLVHGYGPVFNPGERVESSTSTLWELLLAFCALFRRFVAVEWSAVVLGIAFSVVGLVFAQLAALRLARRPPNRIALPLGALIVCGLAPFWDFATSGLETGMVIGWLGLSFFALVRALEARTADRPPPGWGIRGNWDALLIGLGVLIRPDAGVFVVGFAALLLVLRWTGDWREVVKIGVWGATIPLAYQVFRMGYYAALVPTPAVAKEAGRPWWHQGWLYLTDFSRPYHLWFPLLVVSLVFLIRAGTNLVAGARRQSVLTLAVGAVPVLCGLLSAAFVTRVGGDFMHGRMLLPATFAVLLPVMAVPASRAALAAVAVVGIWTVPAITSWRVHYPHGAADVVGREGIANERGFYLLFAQRRHPVTVADYGRSPAVEQAQQDREAAANGTRALVRSNEVDAAKEVKLPRRADAGPNYVVQRGQIGIYGYAAGPKVFIVDTVGLGDPLTARFSLEKRVRPGHEKVLPVWWLLARFGQTESAPAMQTSAEAVDQARASLSCRPLTRLLDAVDRPLTVGRFVSNVRQAAGFDRLRVDPDPGKPAC